LSGVFFIAREIAKSNANAPHRIVFNPTGYKATDIGLRNVFAPKVDVNSLIKAEMTVCFNGYTVSIEINTGDLNGFF
jgi:hypothetical protein